MQIDVESRWFVVRLRLETSAGAVEATVCGVLVGGGNLGDGPGGEVKINLLQRRRSGQSAGSIVNDTLAVVVEVVGSSNCAVVVEELRGGIKC